MTLSFHSYGADTPLLQAGPKTDPDEENLKLICSILPTIISSKETYQSDEEEIRSGDSLYESNVILCSEEDHSPSLTA